MKKNVNKFVSKLLVLALIVSLLAAFALTANAASNDPYKTTPDTAAPAEVKSEAKTDATGKAEATVTEDTMKAALATAAANAAKEGKKPAVEVAVTVAKDAKSLEVSLPSDSLASLAKDEGTLTLKSDVADIELNGAALKAVADQATTGPISVQVASKAPTEMPKAQQDALAKFESAASSANVKPYDFSLKSGDTEIHSFGQGEVEISLPFTGKDPKAYYLNDRGLIERLVATLTNGKVSFKTSHFSTYLVSDGALVDETLPKDVIVADGYVTYINWAIDNGIATPTSDGKITPRETCTRAQFVTFLWKAVGSPEVTGVKNPFEDVSASDGEVYKAVLWAYKNGVTLGEDDTHFGPTNPVLRAQAVTLMKRYADQQPDLANKTGVPNFPDVWNGANLIPYYDAIGWAKANSITIGRANGNFGPMDNCQRDEMLTFLYRLFMETV